MIDEFKELILIEGKDKTVEIAYYNNSAEGINIRFQSNDTIYQYRDRTKISILKNPKSINPASCRIYTPSRCLFDIVKILDFTSHIKIFYGSGKVSTYKRHELRFEHNALMQEGTQQAFDYLKDLAKNISNEDNDFLDKQYEKMKYLSEHSVLAKYLECEAIKKNTDSKTNIFPFGLNLSQETAVAKALSHQVSIIEGPPGTGKTQTILNIIANLLINNKTVAVVSNNNSAIQNVYDKLEANNLSFFAAMLGNKKNIEEFFKCQQKIYPEIAHEKDNTSFKCNSLESNIVRIKEMLKAHNDLAEALQNLEALKREKYYFMQMYGQQEVNIPHEKLLIKHNLEQVLSFLAEIKSIHLQGKQISFFFKIKAFIQYKIFSFSFYKYPLDTIILFVQKCFYEIQERDLKIQIHTLENFLKDSNFEAILDAYKNESMALLKLHLSKTYNLNESRQQFANDILWKDFETFSKEYPVVLSTTHSLRNCTGEDFLYDYLIIDEASQVDIVAGGLALSCAKNVVIVGDQKQLPHIVTQEIALKIHDVFNHYTLSKYYHYEYSLLASASNLFKEAPKTLLKEHYRCHPQIIDFCNKKFYNNELIILSKAKDTEKPLILINTAEGNHARGQYNQRQIDVIQNEILPHVNATNVGIISPFRKQVSKLHNSVAQDSGIEIDTVHKYQGREKDVIIITTVVDEENEFADDPNLLNVAISRAKEKLYIVVSDRENNKNMKDLVNYIRYNNLDIIESKIYSIFDLLYTSYAPHLKRHLDKIKNISTYQSENLINSIIDEVLNLEQYAHLDYVLHYSLHQLIKETSMLDEEELAFTQTASHVDFLIYNKFCKQPILTIEVDGVTYHENNALQLKRDALKDRILEKCNIPIIRFATNGSGEEQKLINKLEEVL